MGRIKSDTAPNTRAKNTAAKVREETRRNQKKKDMFLSVFIRVHPWLIFLNQLI
jgi:hypothetical protein